MKNSIRMIYFILSIGFFVVFSISCKSNGTIDPIPGSVVADVEGNIYKTVSIGSQTWMAENLKSTKLNDGTVIPLVTNNNKWSNLTSPAYSYYLNDSASYKFKFGALYNWYTVETNKLCPTGWHVPSDADWTTLNTYLGVDSIAGGKLKATGTNYWYSPNSYATNSTGFDALPCGYRFYNGSFQNFGYSGNWWTSTVYSSGSAYYRYLTYSNGKLRRNFYDKLYGFSVRCVKD